MTLRLLVFLSCATIVSAQHRFEPSEVDCGLMLQMEKRSLTFEVVNESETTLDPAGFEFDCGCFRLVEAPGPVPAGKRGRLVLELDTGYFEGRIKKGMRWRQGKRVAEAEIRFEVEPEYRIRPAMQQLGALERGAVRSVEFRIEARRGRAPALKVLRASRWLEAELEVADLAEDGTATYLLAVEVKVPEDARLGSFEQQVHLEAADDRIGPLTLGLAGHIEADLQLRPSVLDFGRLKATETPILEARIESRDGRPFEVLGLDRGQEIALVSKHEGPASRHDLQFRLVRGLPVAVHRGHDFLKTSHPKEGKLKIAWRARVIEEEMEK